MAHSRWILTASLVDRPIVPWSTEIIVSCKKPPRNTPWSMVNYMKHVEKSHWIMPCVWTAWGRTGRSYMYSPRPGPCPNVHPPRLGPRQWPPARAWAGPCACMRLDRACTLLGCACEPEPSLAFGPMRCRSHWSACCMLHYSTFLGSSQCALWARLLRIWIFTLVGQIQDIFFK